MKPTIFLLLLAVGAAAAPAKESVTLTPCELEHPLRLTVVAAQCGELRVPEQPDTSSGAYVTLHVARVPAVSRRHQPDPLFVLAGGPGLAASTFYATVAAAFERIRRDRDIVLVDQRGTGRSSALNCALDEELLYRASEAEIADQTRRCLLAVSTRADVRWYTTSLAVRDLEQVRHALGYGRINLYGSSYGTRVAQQYLRHYPQQTRSVILDGVVPPDLALGPAAALDAESALASILARCTRQPACRASFGDPAEAYRRVRTRLAERAVAVSVLDPTSGEPLNFEFTGYHLATVLRLASYGPEPAALLPLMLHQAAASGDFTPLAAQFLLVSRSYEDLLSYGMHNSVVCTEDVPFYAAIDRAKLERTYLGTLQLDGLRTICALWPRGAIDADLHAPLRSDVPALLLSGSDDPVTPPAYAEATRRGFAHSLHVVLQGFGHGQLGAPCVDRIMARFVERASLEGLDTSCTRTAVPLAFFTSRSAPPP